MAGEGPGGQGSNEPELLPEAEEEARRHAAVCCMTSTGECGVAVLGFLREGRADNVTHAFIYAKHHTRCTTHTVPYKMGIWIEAGLRT